MKIFVSYTTRDGVITRDFLSSLAGKLSDLGDVYIDILHNDSKDKQERVKNELQEADIFLLLSTSSIKKSPWVAWEINKANSLGVHKITIDATDLSTCLIIEKSREFLIKAIYDLS